MPEFDAEALRRYGAVHVFAVMLVPDDGKLREVVESALISDLLSRTIADDASIPGLMFRNVYRLPRFREALGGRGGFRRTVEHGSAVGQTFDLIVRAHESGFTELASLSKCLRAASQKQVELGWEDHSVRTLERAWRRFSPVAHLWFFGNAFLGAWALQSWGSDRKLFLKVLSFAEQLRLKGESLVPRGRRADEAILDPARTWRMPVAFRLPDIPLELAPLEPDEVALFHVH